MTTFCYKFIPGYRSANILRLVKVSDRSLLLPLYVSTKILQRKCQNLLHVFFQCTPISGGWVPFLPLCHLKQIAAMQLWI